MPKGFCDGAPGTQTYSEPKTGERHTDEDSSTPTSPWSPGRPPKSPRPRALRPPPPSGLLPQEVLLPGFSLATKPDLCCPELSLKCCQESHFSLPEFPLLQDNWTFQTFPDYSQPTHHSSVHLQAVDVATQIPHGPQTCHVF